jgi:hypothetical protein
MSGWQGQAFMMSGFWRYQQQLQEHWKIDQQAAVISLPSSIQLLLQKTLLCIQQPAEYAVGFDFAGVVSCCRDNFALLVCHFMIA